MLLPAALQLALPWHLISSRRTLFPCLLVALCAAAIWREYRRRKPDDGSPKVWYPPRRPAGLLPSGSAQAPVALPLLNALQQGRWSDAVPLLAASPAMSSDPWTAYHLGLAYAGLGARREAEACYRAACELAPGHRDANYNLACLLAETDRALEALGLYKQLTSRDPGDVSALFNMGHVYFALRMQAPAAQAWKAAKLAEPHAIDVRANMRLVARMLRIQHAPGNSTARRAAAPRGESLAGHEIENSRLASPPYQRDDKAPSIL